MIVDLEVPEGLHPKTRELVTDFAMALAAKLHRSEQKYGYSDGWSDNNWKAECQLELLKHVGKGDPLDVAAYCAFMWKHCWPTISKPFSPQLPPDFWDHMEKLKNIEPDPYGGLNIRSSFG